MEPVSQPAIFPGSERKETQAGGGAGGASKGRFVFRGFADPHVHIWKVGQLQTDQLDLRGTRSLHALLQRIKDFSEQLPKGEWLLARGYNEALFTDERRPPNLAELDAVLGDRPAFIQRTCAHIALVGTATLKAANISSTSVNPPGGYIERDQGGAATGLLTESAMGLVQRHIPQPSQADFERWIVAGCQALLKHGIVCATDPAVMPDLLAAYKSLDERGALPMYVSVLAIRRPDGGRETLPLPEPVMGRRLSIEGVKFFADGGLSGRTAALINSYRDDPTPGILRFDGTDEEEQFFTLAREAVAADLAVGTHAIGDRAIAQVLRIYDRLRREFPAANLRIEHFGLPTVAQIADAARLKVQVVTQPIFLYELGDNFQDYLPDSYMLQCYPFRSMLRGGLSVKFSSDGPVVNDLSPLKGAEAAVSRLSAKGRVLGANEVLSAQEALSAYDFIERRTGRTRVELSEDPLITPPNRWNEIGTETVMIDEEVRYGRPTSTT